MTLSSALSRLLLVGVTMGAGCGPAPDRPAQPPADTSTQPPATPPVTSVPVPRFDGDRAFALLERQVAFGPRSPNSRGARECRDWLAMTLKGWADEIRLQEFTHEGYGEILRLSNVIAVFRPEMKERILLLAHWDTRPRAEQDPVPARREEPILGANDGASGVAVLLELARLFKENPPPVGVDILLTDGEDYGREGDLANYFLGARHFAGTKPADYLPRYGILLDMVGDTHLEIPREGYSQRYAPDVMNLVYRTARELGVGQFVNMEGTFVDDDHLPLNEAGIKTIDLIDFDYPDPTNRFWHTHWDTPDKCSPASLAAVGRVLTTVVYRERP